MFNPMQLKSPKKFLYSLKFIKMSKIYNFDLIVRKFLIIFFILIILWT